MWSEQLALGVQSDGSWLTSAAADEEGRPNCVRTSQRCNTCDTHVRQVLVAKYTLNSLN